MSPTQAQSIGIRRGLIHHTRSFGNNYRVFVVGNLETHFRREQNFTKLKILQIQKMLQNVAILFYKLQLKDIAPLDKTNSYIVLDVLQKKR